ncbi:B12-binding domain-containing radical SAM protein [Pseudomarimonas arenosa]|uniref:B12-binding domain-containing radical SAM protein n=1 Tax=Pseudomarimonas arenosa TaxID=2774145 RepID=UPI002FC367F2
MNHILLTTLNARYAHASLGLRYLRANLGALRSRSAIREFIIGQKSEDIAEQILAEQPSVVGLGVYIWNVDECTQLVRLLKRLQPDLIVVLGGPEVSYESGESEICQWADYVISGWGDISFADLCVQIFEGAKPESKFILGIQPPLESLQRPYDEYTDEDVAKRYVYVEASRGCPFKCEFCLSALDKTAWPFPLDAFLDDISRLYQRGVRQFKFVDRTFNLKIDTSIRILQFFLDKLEQSPEDPLFVHFELVPDHLPERLREWITRFPAGTLQFEIGIQTFDPEVQQRISRRQKNELARANLEWLRQHTQAHLHVDLIAGLPGETVDMFARGFDQLVALRPHEIQFGILKRLRGAPIARHSTEFDLRFNPAPPYNILSTRDIDFSTMQRLSRFARYWDIIANSGRFTLSLPLLLGDTPFASFLAFSDWLYQLTGKSHAFAPERLARLLHQYIEQCRPQQLAVFDAALQADHSAGGARGPLDFEAKPAGTRQNAAGATPKRQRRHLRQPGDPAAAQSG